MRGFLLTKSTGQKFLQVMLQSAKFVGLLENEWVVCFLFL